MSDCTPWAAFVTVCGFGEPDPRDEFAREYQAKFYCHGADGQAMAELLSFDWMSGVEHRDLSDREFEAARSKAVEKASEMVC